MARERDGGFARSSLRWLPAVVLAGFMLFAFVQGWHRFFSLTALIEHRDALDAFVETNFPLALLAYLGVYVAVVALSLPGGTLMTMTGGLLFGWLAGGLAALVAASIGATLVFLIATSTLGDVLARRVGPQIERLRAGFNRDALSYLLFLRLVPAFPFWLVNLAPALLGVRLRVFLIATLIGIAPGTFAFAFLGAGLDGVVREESEALEACHARGGEDCRASIGLGDLVSPEILIALGALGGIALVPVLLRARRGNAGHEPEGGQG